MLTYIGNGKITGKRRKVNDASKRDDLPSKLDHKNEIPCPFARVAARTRDLCFFSMSIFYIFSRRSNISCGFWGHKRRSRSFGR